MTREEIIQGLQFTIDMFLYDPLTGEPITKPRNDMDKTTIDACKGAIELLEQEPQTFKWCHDCSEYDHEKHCCPRYNKVIRNAVEEIKPCDDAISRQAVLDLAVTIETDDYSGNEIMEVVDINDVKALPPVQPKIKMGHWITTRTFMHDGEYYCDKCKCDSPNNEKWDYCPNCGAKMIEVVK